MKIIFSIFYPRPGFKMSFYTEYIWIMIIIVINILKVYFCALAVHGNPCQTSAVCTGRIAGKYLLCSLWVRLEWEPFISICGGSQAGSKRLEADGDVWQVCGEICTRSPVGLLFNVGANRFQLYRTINLSSGLTRETWAPVGVCVCINHCLRGNRVTNTIFSFAFNVLFLFGCFIALFC